MIIEILENVGNWKTSIESGANDNDDIAYYTINDNKINSNYCWKRWQ